VRAKGERVDAGRIVFTDGDEQQFGLLIAVPPHRPPEVVSESGLTGPHGWIAVDPGTLATQDRGPSADRAGDKVAFKRERLHAVRRLRNDRRSKPALARLRDRIAPIPGISRVDRQTTGMDEQREPASTPLLCHGTSSLARLGPDGRLRARMKRRRRRHETSETAS
jgi:NADPH-dependent 2,4-dienoyl-CoA reductase/sulfur reductase-like enzyme